MRWTLYLLSFLAPCFFEQGALAQWSWRIVHADTINGAKYCPTAISCNGDNCTASAIVFRNPIDPETYRIIFLRSDDAGKTWIEQDPGLQYNGNNWVQWIQQIDSLNIVATADSGILLRSSNAGQSWEFQDYHPSEVSNLADEINFSDPLHGIITTKGFSNQIRITSDGGMNWLTPDFAPLGLSTPRSDGGGQFRVLGYSFGPIYHTNDSWVTFDSLRPIIATAPTAQLDTIITFIHWSNSDTMIAFGQINYGHNNVYDSASDIILRTINGGQRWISCPISDLPRMDRQLQWITRFDRDTIIAIGGNSGGHSFLLSTDRGQSWTADTFSVSWAFRTCRGLVQTKDGTPLAIFGALRAPFTNGVLVRGERATSSTTIKKQPLIFAENLPNPFSISTSFHINLVRVPYFSLRVFDAAGREVRRIASGMRAADEHTITFVRENLPAGVYFYRLSAGSDSQTGSMVIE